MLTTKSQADMTRIMYFCIILIILVIPSFYKLTLADDENPILNNSSLVSLVSSPMGNMSNITCGNKSLDYEWVRDSVVIRNYSCTEAGNEESMVLTQGAHSLMFKYGNDVEYAIIYTEIPTCAVLNSVGEYYRLTADITDHAGSCFNITADNVTLDCAGYTIDGTNPASGTASAINATDRNNLTIANCTIQQFRNAVWLKNTGNSTTRNITVLSSASYGFYIRTGSDNNTFVNNSISSSSTVGVYLSSSSTNTFVNNSINGTNGGWLDSSDSNTFVNNSISGSNYVVYLSSSSTNTFVNNSISGPNYVVYLTSSSTNTFVNNSISGPNVVYLLSSSSSNTFETNSISGSNNGVYLSSSGSNTFENNSISSSSSVGVYLISASTNTFENNSISSSGTYGVYLSSSSTNTFENNSISSSTADAIYLTGSSSNVFRNNTLIGHTDAGDNGVELSGASSNNKFDSNYIRGYGGVNSAASGTGNNFYNNTIIASVGNGVYLATGSLNTFKNNTISSSTYGVYLSSSSSNTFENNSISGSSSIGVYLSSSSSNTFENNTISGLGGISLSSSSSNTFENNSISGSKTGVYLSSSSTNTFENNSISSSSSYGVYLSSSSSNTIALNRITAGSTSYGVYVYANSDSNIIERNNITRGLSGVVLDDSAANDPNNNIIRHNRIVDMTRYGIYASEDADGTRIYGNTVGDPTCGINITKADNVVVANNTVANNSFGVYASVAANLVVRNNSVYNNTYGITLNDTDSGSFSNNSVFDTTPTPDDKYGVWVKGGSINNILKNMRISAITNDIYISDEVNTNNIFLNCSYDSEYIGSGAELIRQWYVRANVTTSGSPTSSNVTFENKTSVKIGTNQTSDPTTGLTPWVVLTEYKNASGITQRHTNYTVNATKLGYTTNSTSFNFTNNKQVNVTLSLTIGTCIPVANQNWDLDCSDNCLLSNLAITVRNLSVTNAGTILLDHYNITCEQFTMQLSVDCTMALKDSILAIEK